MTDDTTQEQLTPVDSAELSPDDKKIAAKRAKKQSISVDLSEEVRRQELNAKKAQTLTIEFNEKLNALGFVLTPRLKILSDAIVAGFDLRPMTEQELSSYEQAMNAKAEVEKKQFTDPRIENDKDGEANQ